MPTGLRPLPMLQGADAIRLQKDMLNKEVTPGLRKTAQGVAEAMKRRNQAKKST